MPGSRVGALLVRFYSLARMLNRRLILRTNKENQMAQATPGSNYTVQPGDTLSSIAQQAYGDANQWQKIYDANKQVIGNDPNLIRPGEVLSIPALSPTPGSNYTVQAGDRLPSLSTPTCHDAHRGNYPL